LNYTRERRQSKTLPIEDAMRA